MKAKVKSATIIFIIAIVWLVFMLFWIKIIDYRAGIDGDLSIHGTYMINNDNDELQEYMTIAEPEGKYEHFQAKQYGLIQKGKIEKDTDGFYILYNNGSKEIHGKIIASYEKIYFIDGDLRILEFGKVANHLRLYHLYP